jgi:hypothetical protein
VLVVTVVVPVPLVFSSMPAFSSVPPPDWLMPPLL